MPAATFKTYLLPTLTVSDCRAAVAFYKDAFEAIEVSSTFEMPGPGVALLAIGEAQIVVADEAPEHGNLSPLGQKVISIRMGLMVADPDTFAKNAIAHGATEVYPVTDQSYGYRLGHLVDPFGHHWEIGRPIDAEKK